MAKHSELIKSTATQLIARLKAGEITPHDLLNALEARIAEANPAVNALPTLCFDRARREADRLLKRPVSERGPLAGLPVPIKDLVDVAGVRSTQGSPIFANRVPDKSDIVVEHIEANGGLVYAMSNTPEFGAGANTFNEVFGATVNPWNTSRSVAGSSGGAAAALAAGMAWIAHGSDQGGSLRNPASFCGVTGIRPSIGRVARTPGAKVDRTLTVQGPMARNVTDLALALDAMSGEHPLDLLSLPATPGAFQKAAGSGWKPKKVAYSADLGITPVDPEVAAITRKAAQRFADAGVIVEEAHPDLREAHDCVQTLRAFDFAISQAKLLREQRDKLKPEVIWNIEKGLKLTMDQIEKAEAQRLVLMKRLIEFFEQYDLLLAPTTIVAAFPIEQRYLAECAGKKFDNYVEWLAIVYAITLACGAAMSLPCGFTRENLPVGLQIIGPPRGEGRVLAGAKLLEDVLGMRDLLPIDPRVVGVKQAAE
jgi:amidase